MSEISIEELRRKLKYDPETGVITWLTTQRKGMPAGTTTKQGYVRIEVNGVNMYAQRIAWMLLYGKSPDLQIDHINRNKSDNRASNLRLVNNSENQQNVTNPRKNNKVGLLGVTKVNSGYVACIWHGGKQRYIGTFKEKEMAHQKYLEAKQVFHKGYAK